MREPERLVVSDDASNQRLDVYLARHLDHSRQAIQRFIAAGLVTVNDSEPRKRQLVHPGDRICMQAPPPVADSAFPQPEDIPLSILYEDEAMLVIDKPPGFPVHPGAGHPSHTIINALLAHSPVFAEFENRERPGIVHRLDMDTSGVLIAAKTEADRETLSNHFKVRNVSKTYQALVYGLPRTPVGNIDAPIGRHPVNRKQMRVDEEGREAHSDFKVLDKGPAHARLRVRISTGRTHQIRVHLTHIGHPIMGDKVYGRSRVAGFPRQMLHAWQIALPHPRSGEKIAFEAPIPADFTSAWERMKALD
ncbi:MAG: 23S rRNA pseudouridine1911/1915/1917 synthase [Rhodothermales bacterium]|jgi:23S rRNA pseudouridine1911/1915/1917 synthase